MPPLHVFIGRAEHRHFRAELVEIENARFKAVVEIRRVVRNFVHKIDDLRFERRAFSQQIFGECRKLGCRVIARMLDDALAHLKRKVESRKIQISLFELLDNPQRMEIVIEAVAMLAHARVELAFSRVSEGRVADVVNEGEGFGESGIEAERGRDGAGNLRDFDGVGETIAKMIGKSRSEYLGLGFQAAEGSRVDARGAVETDAEKQILASLNERIPRFFRASDEFLALSRAHRVAPAQALFMGELYTNFHQMNDLIDRFSTINNAQAAQVSQMGAAAERHSSDVIWAALLLAIITAIAVFVALVRRAARMRSASWRMPWPPSKLPR